MRTLMATVLIAVLAVPFACFGASNLNLAVVDVQDVIDKIDEGKMAKENLESEKKQKEATLETKRKEFETLKSDYEKQRLILSQDALMEKQKSLQMLAGEIQNSLMTANDELNKRYNEVLVQLYRKIESVVTKLAKENNYSMVLEKGEGRGVMYTLSAYDITQKVVDTYNQVYAPKKKGKGKK